MEASYTEINSDTFEITFESDYALLNYKGNWNTFIDSYLTSRNGRDIEEEFTAIELRVTEVTDGGDKLVSKYPDMESDIQSIIQDHLYE